MVKKKVEISRESAWNLSEAVILQIQYLIQKASSNYSNGRFKDCLIDSKEIVLLGSPLFTKEEKEILKQKESVFNKISIELGLLINRFESDWRVDVDENLEKQYKKIINKLKNRKDKALMDYREITLQFLDKYGVYMQKKQDTTSIS